MATICKLVTNFKNECVTTAWNPKRGNPGMGVAFAPDKPKAKACAMEL